jgi:tRNA threonylcarbamoyl adenosine modification protein (Sua5/YciO/YrdC/YwlC family)
MTKILNKLSDKEVSDLLLAGHVGVIPTDTVYGLVCRASDERAVERLYALKDRQQKPGTLIAANVEQFVDLGIKARYLKAVEQFWPNPISIEIPHSIAYLNQGTGRQALRIPDDEALQTLLVVTGPLQTTSANQPGQPEATTIDEAIAYFGDSVDFYVEGGDLSGRKPSTLIRIIDDAIDVVREGAVKINEKGEIEQ